MTISDAQLNTMEITERFVSVLSLIGSTFVIATFLFDKHFHKPINRLVFYASWGNIITNTSTLAAMHGIRLGAGSPLCQFQGFVMQWFIPADALWIFAMACNVYLTLFHDYKTSNLQALEWRYLVFCYGLPFLPAFTYLFLETPQSGKVYGPALTWCWISIKWDGLRIATLYGPAWIIITATFAIYVRAGIKVFQLRQQLLHIAGAQSTPRLATTPDPTELTDLNVRRPMDERKPSACSETWTRYKRNYDFPARKFSEISASGGGDRDRTLSDATTIQGEFSAQKQGGSNNNNIVWAEKEFCPSPASTNVSRATTPIPPSTPLVRRTPTVADANRAAINYCKCALLFFIALIVTWVPSSLNRVYSLMHPDAVVFGLNYASGMVLPLQGFWNAVIYIATSFSACRALWARLFRRTDRPLSFTCASPAEGPRTPVMIPHRFGESSTHLTV